LLLIFNCYVSLLFVTYSIHHSAADYHNDSRLREIRVWRRLFVRYRTYGHAMTRYADISRGPSKWFYALQSLRILAPAPRPETGKTLVFLTNRFALPALKICALCKCRWQVT
jgi:hypothetical protein